MTRTRTIEWQVAGACNYDCSYCIQSPRYRKGRPQRDQLARAIESFAALPGTWEIKCSGGEAFAHPLFMAYVVPELMARTPHRKGNNMGALIGGGIATLLTLCILSRAIGDNPIYRFAQSLLVGTGLGYFSAVYGVVALAMSAVMIALAVQVFRIREGVASVRAAHRLFVFSIVYLFVLFATLLVEALLPAALRLVG